MRKIAKFEMFSPGMAPETAPAEPRTRPKPKTRPKPPPRPKAPPKRLPRIPKPGTKPAPVAGDKSKIMGFDNFASFGKGQAAAPAVDERAVADRFIAEMLKRGESVKKFMESR